MIDKDDTVNNKEYIKTMNAKTFFKKIQALNASVFSDHLQLTVGASN